MVLTSHDTLDPVSDAPDAHTADTRRFRSDEAPQRERATTLKLSDVKAGDFDATFYPGGHGPLWDLAEDAHSRRLIESCAANGRPIGAVCHAPAAFRHAQGAGGRKLVAGKRVTGFANSEEQGVHLTDVVPFLVEDMLKENGGAYEKGADWSSYVVRDGTLVTGQNPASSGPAATELLTLLK